MLMIFKKKINIKRKKILLERGKKFFKRINEYINEAVILKKNPSLINSLRNKTQKASKSKLMKKREKV